SEGPLPACAQERAVEHERERTKAVILRQPPLPYAHPGRLCGDLNGEPHSIRVDEERADPVASKVTPSVVMPTAPRTIPTTVLPSAPKTTMPAPPANNSGSLRVLEPTLTPGSDTGSTSSIGAPPVTEPALPPMALPPANLPPGSLPPGSLP